MGQAIGGVSEATALSEPASRVDPIGSYLARQRKLRGISLDELESLTHIPRRSLERLESGAYDGDPDGFVRGFVRTVSLAIGLDPEDTVSRMLAEPAADRAGGRLYLGRVGLALAVVLGLGLALALVPAVLQTTLPAPDLTRPDRAPAVRWDAVRELAESVGAVASRASAPDAAALSGAAPRPLPSHDGGGAHPGPRPPGR